MNQSNAIKQPWLSLVRLAWIALAMYGLLPGLLRIPEYYRQLVALNPWPNNPGWTQATFSAAVAHTGLAPQVVAWIILVPVLIKILVFLSLGLYIFWRKSNEWQGLLVSFVLVGLCGTFEGDTSQFWAVFPTVWQVVAKEMGALFWLVFFMFLILFPNGRFTPRWMRWVALGLAIWFVVNEAENLIFGKDPDLILAVAIVLIVLILIGKVHRYRRLSEPVERLQIRWFLFSITAFITYAILQIILVRAFPLPPQPGTLEVVSYLVEIYLADFVILLIPIAVGIAIFRYRLWDIDLIIRRTLQYGTLTAILAGLYYGGVLVFGELLRAVTGQDSPLALVLSTLVIAALVTPLRRRIQAFIDRRFYRQKYNTDHAVTTFAAASRSEVELGALADKLTKVAGDSLQPESISLWLRKSEVNR